MSRVFNIKPHDTKLSRYFYLKLRKSLIMLMQSMILIQDFSKSVDIRVILCQGFIKRN